MSILWPYLHHRPDTCLARGSVSCSAAHLTSRPLLPTLPIWTFRHDLSQSHLTLSYSRSPPSGPRACPSSSPPSSRRGGCRRTLPRRERRATLELATSESRRYPNSPSWTRRRGTSRHLHHPKPFLNCCSPKHPTHRSLCRWTSQPRLKSRNNASRLARMPPETPIRTEYTSPRFNLRPRHPPNARPSLEVTATA